MLMFINILPYLSCYDMKQTPVPALDTDKETCKDDDTRCFKKNTLTSNFA